MVPCSSQCVRMAPDVLYYISFSDLPVFRQIDTKQGSIKKNPGHSRVHREPMVGLEPTTSCLQNSCSTTELHRLENSNIITLPVNISRPFPPIITILS